MDLLWKRDTQCLDEIQELPNLVLEKLPRELRDMIYSELYNGSQDEPYEVVDNNSVHPYDPAYEFTPMVKAYELPYWMLEGEVGPEFAREAVEVWYKHVHLSIDIKLLLLLLQDDDGILFDSWSPSVRTCDYLTRLNIVIGPAVSFWTGAPRPSSQAVHTRQMCSALSTLLDDRSVARKANFRLHIEFRWHAGDNWPAYLKAICPIVYRLKAQGFLVSSSLAYECTIRRRCFQEGCECEAWRLGEIGWKMDDIGDLFDGSEEDCMKIITEQSIGSGK
jgi:hypothetical protein